MLYIEGASSQKYHSPFASFRMGQRRDFAIFLSTILFSAAVAPHQKVAPFVSLGQLFAQPPHQTYIHYCMATVVAQDEASTHTGPRRLFAITSGHCSETVGKFPTSQAQFELGPAKVLGWQQSGKISTRKNGPVFDIGQWSRVGVVKLQAEGIDEGALALADWKSETVAELFRRERVLKAESEALQNVPMFVADWNQETGQFTTTDANIVPIEQCSQNIAYYKKHFICVQTSESIYFSNGAPLYKVTGQEYTLLGTLTASQYIKVNQHLFLNVRANSETVQGLIQKLQESGGMRIRGAVT